jgi:hypothetical protein
LSAPTAPTTPETKSDRVETITRAAKVEAFMPWSETVFRYVSSARTRSVLGIPPESM